MTRLFIAERKAIAAQPEFDRTAERRPADDFDARAVAESHLHQPALEVRISADRNDKAAAADAHLVQRARLGIAAVVASGRVTSLLHRKVSCREPRLRNSSVLR